MRHTKYFHIIFLFLFFGSLSAANAQYYKGGYLKSPQMSVLTFHNEYAVGKQGGIEFILRNYRLISNGNMYIEYIGANNKSIRLFPDPIFDEIEYSSNSVVMPFEVEEPRMKYNLRVDLLDDTEAQVTIELKEVENNNIDRLYFQMEFYPEVYKGQPYFSDSDTGFFPHEFQSKIIKPGDTQLPVPFAKGEKFSFSPGNTNTGCVISSDGTTMEMLDYRLYARREWFVLQAPIVPEINKPVQLKVTFPSVNNYQKQPVISYSRNGYHPNQKKQAVIELDNGQETGAVSLLRVHGNGKTETVKRTDNPAKWGSYMRYDYVVFDFTDVRTPGLYQLQYGTEVSDPFMIAQNTMGEDVWSLTLGTFLPVQMCHMEVHDRDRMWHGACHLDDGLQAPLNHTHFDSFEQGAETGNDFKPLQHIPGFTSGGWHDAGDDDINVGSTGKATYHLALAVDEFGLDYDNTTVDFPSKKVYINQPDQKSDALQQIEHGLNWLMASYEVADYTFAGVISQHFKTYHHVADWGLFTDNLFYNNAFPADSSNGYYSGVSDDRFIFTNRHTPNDYYVAATLAASARVLNDYNPDLAAKSLQLATEIWEREQNRYPVLNRVEGGRRNLLEEKVKAAVELFLTTNDKQYLEPVYAAQNKLEKEFESIGWIIARAIKYMDNHEFVTAFTDVVNGYSKNLMQTLAENPYGVPDYTFTWGWAWPIMEHGMFHYYLAKQFPQQFPREVITDAFEYIMGKHPYSNISLVSSVGQHAPVPAFGINRADYGHIPGGIYSGPALIKPDYPEYKDDHPFLWHQSEYQIFRGSTYLFLVHAANAVLQQSQ